MLLKQADRSATLSFCPTGPFLAAGSVAGAIDLSFSTSSVLEVRRGEAVASGAAMIAPRAATWGVVPAVGAQSGAAHHAGAVPRCCRFSGLTSPAPTMI